LRIVPTIREDAKLITGDLAQLLPALAGSTLLVTGAQGFLCSYIVDAVAHYNDVSRKPPCRIIVVDNLSSSQGERLAHLTNRRDVVFLQHDVARPLVLDEPLHWIVHGASIASPSIYRQYPLETIDANVTGTRNLLALAGEKNVRGMVIMSSSEIYGDPQPEFVPTPETYRGNVSCFGPRACYDESKRMAETLCWVYHDKFGIRANCIRPFNVYGPGLRLEDKRVLPDFIKTALSDQPIVLFSDGTPTRTFCYVTDFVRGLFHVLVSGKGGEAFNVGNDQGEVSIIDLAERVRQVAAEVLKRPPVPVELRRSEDRLYLVDNPQRRCPDISKMQRFFRWSPAVTLDDGLYRTLRAWCEAGARLSDAAAAAAMYEMRT
jgi:dTDP-glucose 4,6-dehydratase/UDP-glucuronate decarboxylase